MDIKNALASKLLSEITYSYKEEMTEKDIEDMMKDDDVAIALENIENSISSREWTIATTDSAFEELANEIETRFSNLKISELSKKVLRAKFFKNALFYLEWEKENYTLKSITRLPHSTYDFDKEKKQFFIKTNSSKKFIENDFETVLVINEWELNSPWGKSDLETLFKPWQLKKELDDKLAGIVKKYGEIITWFLYDPKMKKEEIEEQGMNLKNMYGRQVIAIPGGKNVEKDKQFGFISLSDLKIDIHIMLAEKFEKKVKRFILGSTLATDESTGGGNFALGSIHAEEKLKKEESYIKFIRDSLQHLIVLDSKLFNYNPNLFYFKFEKEKDIEKEIKIKTDKEKLKAVKLDNLKKMQDLGIKTSVEIVAEELGIDKKHLEYAHKEFSKVDDVRKKKLEGIYKKYSK